MAEIEFRNKFPGQLHEELWNQVGNKVSDMVYYQMYHHHYTSAINQVRNQISQVLVVNNIEVFLNKKDILNQQAYHHQISNQIYKQIWDCMKEHVYLEISRPLRKQVIINMMMEENERS